MLAVGFYLACTGVVVSLSLLGPILAALTSGEPGMATRFGVYLLLGSFLFGAFVLAILNRQRRMPQIGKLSLVALVWTVLPLAAAVPIADMSSLSFLDSLFESTSGLTTTGSSVIINFDTWPRALLFWRVQLQWIGGYLSVLTIVLIVAPLGIGGLTSRTSALSSGVDLVQSQGRLIELAGRFGMVYIAMTTICFLGFFVSGTEPFFAISLAMAAVSTGGFLPFGTPLDQTLNTFGMFIFAVFLLLGATSVFWQRMLFGGQFRRLGEHRESYSVIILIAVLTVVYALLIISQSAAEPELVSRSVVEGFLNGASLVATSGVESRPGVFSLMPLVIVLFIILAGGSAFSTSGGLKHYRLGGMIVQSWSELDRLIYPNAVQSSRFGSQRYDIGLMKAIWSFFLATVLAIAIGCIIVGTSGIPFEASLTAVVSHLSTAGPVYNSGWALPGEEPWPPFSDFSPTAKFALIIVMILGRLEILAILGLFSIRYWSSR